MQMSAIVPFKVIFLLLSHLSQSWCYIHLRWSCELPQLMRVTMIMLVTMMMKVVMVMRLPLWVNFHLAEFAPPLPSRNLDRTLFEPIWRNLSKQSAVNFQTDDEKAVILLMLDTISLQPWKLQILVLQRYGFMLLIFPMCFWAVYFPCSMIPCSLSCHEIKSFVCCVIGTSKGPL